MVIDATNVVVDNDDPDLIVVGFEVEECESPRYLVLQRAHKFDEQDIALGMDRVYIERDDQFYGAYGGIARFELHRDHVLIQMDADGAKKLDEPEFLVRFDLDVEAFEKLRAGLGVVFNGFECFADLAR